MAIKKKATTKKVKYGFSRLEIANKLDEIKSALDDIDVMGTSPDDVAATIADIHDDLDEVASDLISEKA